MNYILMHGIFELLKMIELSYVTSYVHKLFHFGRKARNCINFIYAHDEKFPTMQQSTCITQSYGKFIYRTRSHLAQTPHSSPDQLKVTV